MSAGAIGRAAAVAAGGVDNVAVVADDLVAAADDMAVHAKEFLGDDLTAVARLGDDEVANAQSLFDRIRTGQVSIVVDGSAPSRTLPGTGSRILLPGPTGVGKTSVMDALAAREELHVKRIVLGDDAVLATGHSSPREVPQGPSYLLDEAPVMSPEVRERLLAWVRGG